jgi:hypothetical protein
MRYCKCLSKLLNPTKVYNHDKTNIFHRNSNATIYTYKNIQPHFEYINHILNTKIGKSVIYEYSIIETLTDDEYNRLYYSIRYINENYVHINTNISENEVLFNLYSKIAEYEDSSINLKKMNALYTIMTNYANIKSHVCYHITIIKKFLFFNKLV